MPNTGKKISKTLFYSILPIRYFNNTTEILICIWISLVSTYNNNNNKFIAIIHQIVSFKFAFTKQKLVNYHVLVLNVYDITIIYIII